MSGIGDGEKRRCWVVNLIGCGGSGHFEVHKLMLLYYPLENLALTKRTFILFNS